ncbi:serine/threonine-protein kinase [Streptomyces sp. JV176]|uniref:serine/threonine-protein kinase n=1 Tax=Streptomyces sp. JV176 TaxID=858630 RepID=UPI002E79C097|nr:serine/threonine-protein kinase [Streptomyces sp. JV176]MEE1798540.1 serine/threonine-protein kinase [Streptomyces sp. JV176]
MGEVFAGRYELIDPIGRGGVGAVWRAWDHRRRRYVAAKVLQQSDAHTLLRFVREQALRIDHPHVLAPASWAADDDKVLFTMDLVTGGSLAHVIGDYGPLPPRFVCTLLDQLLAGLAAVHAEGVVHRDIKPANILLDATGTARPHLRLSDFGISMRKGEPRLTETNYVVGTPGYFAPEQMMGAEPDFPADLFAVGLVALYLLQGRKPDSKALVEHFAAHGTPGAPQGIPEPLWQVLAGLVQPDPEARFRTATGARKALTTAVDLLPEAGEEEEPVEIFDQIGPLPPGFGPSGPVKEPEPKAEPEPAPDPRPAPAPVPAPAHEAVPAPEPPVEPSPTPPPTPMSETGSFHLPPPPVRQQAPQQQPQPNPPSHPQPYPSAAELAHSQAQTAAVRQDYSLTRPYTAQSPQAPLPQASLPQQAQPPQPQPQPQPQSAHRTVAHHAPRKRPGPPPKVTVPVLLLALACFAVGFWALTQV